MRLQTQSWRKRQTCPTWEDLTSRRSQFLMCRLEARFALGKKMKFQKKHSRKWPVRMTVLHRSRKKLNAPRWTKQKIWLVGQQNKSL
eukprot:11173365-Lingulodinium_polyedra.AAC.1